MKKIFKKSNILSFILGAIIFGGVGTVVAATILAKDVSYTPKDTSWQVDNVKDAIDDLYTKAKPTYTGTTTFTPTTSNQVIATGNKILTSDITINAIPSTYKNLTTTTTVNSNNLLSGVKAYTSDGTLVTGNLSTTCASGTYNKTANSQINIPLSFTPTKFIITFENSLNNTLISYVTNEITNKTYSYMRYNDNWTISESNSIGINGNSIKSSFSTTLSTGVYNTSANVYYMACK